MCRREINSVLKFLELLGGPIAIGPIFVSMNGQETISQTNLR